MSLDELACFLVTKWVSYYVCSFVLTSVYYMVIGKDDAETNLVHTAEFGENNCLLN